MARKESIHRANGRVYQVIDLDGIDARSGRRSLVVEAGSRIGLAYAKWCSEPSGPAGRAARWLATIAVTPSAQVVNSYPEDDLRVIANRGRMLKEFGGRLKEAVVDTTFAAAKGGWMLACLVSAGLMATSGAAVLPTVGLPAFQAYLIAGSFAFGGLVGKSALTSWQDTFLDRRRLASMDLFAERPKRSGTRVPGAERSRSGPPAAGTEPEARQDLGRSYGTPARGAPAGRKKADPDSLAIFAREEGPRHDRNAQAGEPEHNEVRTLPIR
jgi:hypothetical protein